MKRLFLLYHWSPRSRRNSILKYGLVPNKLSKDKSWRPPYICFSKYPSIAWGQSALMSDIYGEWDLWAVWSIDVKYKTLSPFSKDDRRCRYYTEYRIFTRIPKINVWYVGSRLHLKRKNK